MCTMWMFTYTLPGSSTSDTGMVTSAEMSGRQLVDPSALPTNTPVAHKTQEALAMAH